MKIAVVHSFYSSKSPSGENGAVDQQVSALGAAGHDVRLFGRRTDDLEADPLYPLKAGITVASGRGARPLLSHFNPDVVHVHNLFPNFGTVWLKEKRYPVVSTMHNYRSMCAAGTLFRDGKVCTQCPNRKSSVPGLLHGCYRSRVASLPLTVKPSFLSDAVVRHSDRIIVLSAPMMNRYSELGISPEKLAIVPNFVPDSLDAGIGNGGDHWLYVGRFSDEKGVLELVRSWPVGRKLLLVGAGELDSELRKYSSPWVEVRGSIPRDDVVQLLKSAIGLVFPSKWFEGLPMVYIEALSAGLPVLTWGPSVVGNLVRADGTGSVVDGADLEGAVREAEETFPSIRSNCRSVFERKYTERHVMGRLQEVYEAAIKVWQATTASED